MYLKYYWEDVPVQYLAGGRVEPVYRTKLGNVEYEYEKDIGIDDVVAYLMPRLEDKEQRMLYRTALENMFDFLQQSDAINMDELENDEYFVEYIHDKYEEEAFEEYKESFY